LAKATARISAFAAFVAVSIAFVREMNSAEEKLTTANSQLENLLATMLPLSIAKRLRSEGKTFADGYTNVSVLFADLVGFTSLSERLAPMELVTLLDTLFSSFDAYTEELHLEKIKTIGDAYMVAAGLPEPRSDHAVAAIQLALRIRAEISHYSDLGVRIGINSGEVVAGIIGRKRFIYDLWGDSVNIASRMESHGVVNEIQISESTYREVKDVFDCVERGEIEIKGKGTMKVFLVKGFLPAQTSELERRPLIPE
jgi:class 3 adenylate cyclase